jgi:3-phosphoshikimate 1-carboxyvinyltransferase
VALPELIEIVPPATLAPVRLSVPGSKSITNRALVLAALADAETVLRGALWSEDTEIMVAALRTLGFEVSVEADNVDDSNRSITIKGLGGNIPNSGTPTQPLDIYVGNAGTVTRFLMAMVCLGGGAYRLHGTPRMHQRPQRALLDAIGQLDYHVHSQDGRLPVTVFGETRSAPRACVVSIEESSQFASALLLAATRGGWDVKVVGEDAEESAYVRMTSKLIEAFPNAGGEFYIEPDCSSASYLLAAGALLPDTKLEIVDWPDSDWQIDARFPGFLTRFQASVGAPGAPAYAAGGYPDISRLRDLGDAIMTAIVLAPLLPAPSRFVDLGRLRLQESDRVNALRTELEKCGARVIEDDDTLTVYPSELHSAEIETYDDHRVAMSFSALALKVPGMRIRNPACVGKTFPNFYAKLTTEPPAGLGATIKNAGSGHTLSGPDLLADVTD